MKKKNSLSQLQKGKILIIRSLPKAQKKYTNSNSAERQKMRLEMSRNLCDNGMEK